MQKKRLSIIAYVIAPLLLLAAAARVAPTFSYDRWDNFEYFTPVIAATHFQWLEGRLPQWNPHALMGEPLLSTMQPGVLYFPYTLCCVVIQLFGLSRASLPLLSLLLHTVVAVLGWRTLFARIGVRPLIGALFGTGFALGGYWTYMTAVWLFTAPQCSWLPWLMYAVIRFVGDRTRWNAALLAGLLTLEMYTGYAQIALYVWVFVAVFAAGYLLLVERSRKAAPGLLAVAAVAVLTSGPFLSPAYRYIQRTERAHPMRPEEAFDRSASPRTALDVLMPVYSYNNGFFLAPGGDMAKGQPSIFLHQGAWVAPPIVAAVLLWGIGRKRPKDDSQAPLWNLFWVALFCSALFFVLALGPRGYLLPLTYFVPVWSSLRWPFKFLPLCAAGLALTGGIGLELCWRAERQAKLLWAVSIALPAVAAVMLWANASASEGITDLSLITSVLMNWGPLSVTSGAVCLVAGLASMGAVLPAQRGWPKAVLLVAAPVELVAFLAFVHLNLGYKTYRDVRIGPAELGIDTRYRVLPLSRYEYTPELIPGEYATFSSATRYGYYSVTGPESAGVLDADYARWLPQVVDGVPDPSVVKGLLGSSLLRSFNARYVVVAKDDALNRPVVEANPAYHLHKELGRTLVYEDAEAMPRLYFAQKVLRPPEDYVSAVAANLLGSREPPTTAVVADSYDGPAEETPAVGEVTWSDWRDSDLRVRVKTAGKSFLVISGMYSSGWKARVDGVPTGVHRVNGTIMGIAVPGGAREVRLRFVTPGLTLGAGMFVLGAVCLAAWRRR